MTSSSHKSLTDWNRLDRLRDDGIDLSEQPEPSDAMIARAIVRQGLQPPQRKRQVTLRLDEDVLAWFRASGRGYQSRINRLLRAYMEEAERRRGSDDDGT